MPGEVVLEAISSRFRIRYCAEGGDGGIEQEGRVLRIAPGKGDVFSVPRMLQVWLQSIAVSYLKPVLDRTAVSLGLTYNRVSVRGQRTRWGSCSEKRNINLNRNLLFLPAYIVDYVIRHELTHLRVLDHSPRFWDALENVLPGSQRCRKELRELEVTAVPLWASDHF